MRWILLLAFSPICLACVTETDLLHVDACTPEDAVGVLRDITPRDAERDLDGSLTHAFTEIAIARSRPSTLYAAANGGQGIWKSVDCGMTWSKPEAGVNSDIFSTYDVLGLDVDPTDSDTVYAVVWSTTILQSTNGGVHWQSIMPHDAGTGFVDSHFLARIRVNPHDPRHILASYVAPWVDAYNNDGFDSGIAEGRFNGATWDWSFHPPAAGIRTYANFAFGPQGDTWYVFNGSVWRMRPGATSFETLDVRPGFGGENGFYQSTNGTLYHTSQEGLHRSTDDGATWLNVFEGVPGTFSQTQAIVGDGFHLFTALGSFYGELRDRLMFAPEVPGDRNWEIYPVRPTAGSARRFVRDPTRNFIYSTNDLDGVFRFRSR